MTALSLLYIFYILDWTNANSDSIQEVQSYSIPTPTIQVVPSKHFPALDTEYINQDGPLMIRRTLERNMSKISIAIDKSLETEFSFIQPGQCSAYCQFYFSDSYDEIAAEADGLITDKTKGILATNAALHFTKTVYQTTSEMDMRDYTWFGTDMYAAMEKIPLKDHRETYPAPALFKVHKTLETNKTLCRTVDFKEKQNYIAVFLNPVLCANNTQKMRVSLFLNEIQKTVPIVVADNQCGYNYTVSCNTSDIDCVLRHAKASLIVDPFDQDGFIVPKFWKSLSFSTPVIYSWTEKSWMGKFHDYAPLGTFKKMNSLDAKQVVEFVSKFNQSFFNGAFAWKHNLTQEIAGMLDNSLRNFPCKLCQHIGERKLSTRATLDLVSSSQNVAQTIKSPSAARKMNSVDAVYVNHYSRAAERLDNIKNLSQDLGMEIQAVVGFDKEDLTPEWTKLILQNRETRNNNPFRNSYFHDLRPGEVSLNVKSFWIYYNILKDNKKNTLVVEDDVVLANQNASVDKLLEHIPASYSIFHLGQCIQTYLDTLPQDGIAQEGNFKITANMGDPRHCTSAYMMSKQGAILMFKSLPVAMPIDYQMSGYMPFSAKMTHAGRIDHPNLSVYSVWPAIFKPSLEINDKSSTGIRDK
ncbi:hypothetical protein HDV01_003757 [Terramyces sp. JEL0728]|nr:hypothetical protein HDV01_003757 [Terramyces sp. JEL0728]